ncbi:MAG TPA: 5-formyltetrahydrofolate cyclo-ligase [Candidatus Acidoferrales bacterium]|nr:5-formyltetrahydrofolate cyclo-ligase [Candidatus Acidoferrales bacterium]
MKVSKSAVRRELRAIRRGLAAGVVEAAGSAVVVSLRGSQRYRNARSVIGYLSNENEVPVSGLFPEIIESGRLLFLPASNSRQSLKRWRPGDPLAKGPGGVLEPVGGDSASPASPTLALVPLVGWDLDGTRLGRGGGFYDRLFREMREGVYRVGVGYEFQCWPSLPSDPWDVKLHSVITERRIVEFSEDMSALRKGGSEQWQI